MIQALYFFERIVITEMRRFCVYGKGGIGKSTLVSNIAAALAEDQRDEGNGNGL